MISAQKLRFSLHVQVMSLLILFTLALGASMSPAQQSKKPLPMVIAAGVPFYPPLARVARIEGVIRLRLSTDGKRVSAVSAKSGHPLLVEAAKENVRTWQFKDHSPTTFEVTFRYKMLPESQCEIDNGIVLLRLPIEVEISAKGVQNCDPSTEKSR